MADPHCPDIARAAKPWHSGARARVGEPWAGGRRGRGSGLPLIPRPQPPTASVASIRPPQHPLEQGGPAAWIRPSRGFRGTTRLRRGGTLTRASYAKPSKSRLEAKIDALMQSNASETPETALSSAAYGARQDCLSGFRKSLSSSALASRQKVSHDTHARNAPAGESFRHSLAPTTNFIARFQGVRWPCPIAMLLPSGI